MELCSGAFQDTLIELELKQSLISFNINMQVHIIFGRLQQALLGSSKFVRKGENKY